MASSQMMYPFHFMGKKPSVKPEEVVEVGY